MNGRIFELGAGFVSEIRRQRAKGKSRCLEVHLEINCQRCRRAGANFKPDESFTPSAVAAKWKDITDFSSGSEYPVGMEGKNPMVRSNHQLLSWTTY